MAEEKLNVATYEQILTILTQLATNYTSVFTDYYNMFYNQVPMDITLQIYDEDGTLQDITVPNRAKDKTYILNGNGDPSGTYSADRGSTYQDLANGDVYIKIAGDGTADGWSQVATKAKLDTYVLQGSGSPEGVVTSTKGIIYVDTENATVYIKSYPTGNEGWVLISNVSTVLADKDLSNLTPTGERHFANPSLSNLNSSGEARFSSKEDVSNKVTSVSASSTNTQYPSALATYSFVTNKVGEGMADKEDISNKVIAISSESTNTQYPSAKAVNSLVTNVAYDLKNTPIVFLSGTNVTLTDNSVHKIPITANTTFHVPTVTDVTRFHQMLVLLYMPTAYTIDFGTNGNYFWGYSPDMTRAGYYTVIYEFDGTDWYVGVLYRSDVGNNNA